MSDFDVKAMREWHRPRKHSGGYDYCFSCQQTAPCHATRALDRVEALEAQLFEMNTRWARAEVLLRDSAHWRSEWQDAEQRAAQSDFALTDCQQQLAAAKLSKRAAMERVRDACAERIGNHRGGYASVPIAIHHAQNDIATLDLDALENSDEA